MTDLVRVGEGHYSIPSDDIVVSPQHQQAVQHVLGQMRKLTHRMVLNGEKTGEPTSRGLGEREETSWPALRRTRSIMDDMKSVKRLWAKVV